MSEARDRLNGASLRSGSWEDLSRRDLGLGHMAESPGAADDELPLKAPGPRKARRLAPSTQNRARVRADIDQMIEDYQIKTPKHWDKYGTRQKLDFISTRIIAMNRTTTSFTEMKEEGILSVSQYDRRVRREVYSRQESLDAIPPTRGVFGRAHVKRAKRPSSRDVS